MMKWERDKEKVHLMKVYLSHIVCRCFDSEDAILRGL